MYRKKEIIEEIKRYVYDMAPGDWGVHNYYRNSFIMEIKKTIKATMGYDINGSKSQKDIINEIMIEVGYEKAKCGDESDGKDK